MINKDIEKYEQKKSNPLVSKKANNVEKKKISNNKSSASSGITYGLFGKISFWGHNPEKEKKLAKKLFYYFLASLGVTFLIVLVGSLSGFAFLAYLMPLAVLINFFCFLGLTAHLLILKQNWTRHSLRNQILDYLIWFGILGLGAGIMALLGII